MRELEPVGKGAQQIIWPCVVERWVSLWDDGGNSCSSCAADCIGRFEELTFADSPESECKAVCPTDAGPRRPIAVALARAYKWQRMLDEGEVGSMAELAEGCGVDRSYVGRILKLAALAPGIVEAIFGDEEPSSLSLMELHRPLPLRWDEQCRMLAFPVDGE